MMKIHIPLTAVAFAFVAFGAHNAPEAHAAAPTEPAVGEQRPAAPAPKGGDEAKPIDQICVDFPWGTTMCCTPRSCVTF